MVRSQAMIFLKRNASSWCHLCMQVSKLMIFLLESRNSYACMSFSLNFKYRMHNFKEIISILLKYSEVISRHSLTRSLSHIPYIHIEYLSLVFLLFYWCWLASSVLVSISNRLCSCSGAYCILRLGWNFRIPW